MEQIHPSFRFACAEQQLRCDDILAELEKRRAELFRSLRQDFEQVSRALENGACAEHLATATPQIVANCHNAILVVQKLQKNGQETITLNLGKDLIDQLLASATQIAPDMARRVGAYSAQNRLKPVASPA